MNRSEIKQQAKSLLKGNLWTVLKPLLLITVIAIIFDTIPSILGISTTTTTTTELFGQTIEVKSPNFFGQIWSILSTTIGSVLNLGLVNYLLKFVRGEKNSLEDVFNIIKERFVLVLIVSVAVSVLTTIGSMLLIIPGIIISIGLLLCNYIIVDNKDMKPMDVLKKSWEMMKGHKMEYFVYNLSFLGWILLCVFIIPIMYVVPYMDVTFALYYEKLKKQAN